MDDLLQKGYGLGSGMNLFIVYNICEVIFWECFSPITVSENNEIQFYGAVINTIQSLIIKPDKLKAFTNAMFRDRVTNLSGVLATILIFLIVIYFNGFRLEVKLIHTRIKGLRHVHSIKLFYTSSIPIILLSVVV